MSGNGEEAYIERKRFNTMVFVAIIIAVAVAAPMFGRSVAMTVILALTYVPVVAVIYIGVTSLKWNNYFGKYAMFAMGGLMALFALVATVITRMIAGAFHVSNGMYG